MNVLGPGTQLLLGEPVECLSHQSEVGVQMSLALDSTKSGQEKRIAVIAHEGLRRFHPRPGGVPRRFPSDRASGQVGEHVSHEGTGDAGFVAALFSVFQGGPGCPDPRCRMGQVVGQDLLGLDVPGAGQAPRRAGHDRRGQLDSVVGATEVGRSQIGHG